jgi:hypothetical protein
MRSIQFVRNHLALRPGVAVVTAALFCATIGRADRFPPDPAEELRQALKAPTPNRNLRERVEALRSLADMRRALGLPEWRTETGDADDLASGDRQALLLLIERFKKDVRQVLKQGTPEARLVVMDMLAEMGPSVAFRTSKDAKSDEKGIARTFTAELADLIKRGDTPSVRRSAARALGQIFPDPDVAVSALGDLFASRNVEDRRAAAGGLVGVMRTASQLASKSGTTTGPAVTRGDIVQTARAVVPLASRGLSDPEVEIRRLSAEAILEAAGALNYGKEDRDLLEQTRGDLLSALEVFKGEIPALGKALHDVDLEVRLLIQRALEELGGARQRLLRVPAQASVPAETPRLDGARGAAFDRGRLTLMTMKIQAAAAADPLLGALRDLLPTLRAQVHDPNVRIRLGAIDVLETLGSAAAPAVPDLVQALRDHDRFVRWAAARTLGKMGITEPAIVVPSLARLLSDEDFDVRLSATAALDRFGPAAEAAVPDLVQATKASDAEIREAAIRTLGGIGTGAQPAVPALAAALSDPDARVRQIAAEVLGRFGSLAASAEPALRRALDDLNAEVRKAASDALLSILQAEK